MNGFEIEFSNLGLDLWLVPEDLKFPHSPKEVAYEVAKPNQETRLGKIGAKNHTNVNLTWELADPKRYKFLTKWLSKEKIDEIDYKDYVASSNSSDEQSEDEEEIVWKRALLGLDKESSNESSDEDINWVIGVAKWKQKVDDEGKDIVIKFTSGLEEIAEKVKEKHEKEELE